LQTAAVKAANEKPSQRRTHAEKWAANLAAAPLLDLIE
jgi:hypothetical protein